MTKIICENFYDFYGIDPDKCDNIEEEVKSRLDEIRNKEDNVKVLKSARLIKDVLVDEDERILYERMGHEDYVSENFSDDDFDCIDFGYSEENIKTTNKIEDLDEMEQMISFDTEYSKSDPTIKATKTMEKEREKDKDPVRKEKRISKRIQSDDNSIDESDMGLDKKEDDIDQDSDKSTLLQILKISKYLFIILSSFTVLYIIYTYFGAIGIFLTTVVVIPFLYISKYIIGKF